VRIAVLGWGSLIEEPGDLHLDPAQWLEGGPQLPIELSRLSRGRGHLTYVIDERHLRRVPTRYAFSAYGDLIDVVCDLANRERCKATSIGYAKSGNRSRHRSRTGVWVDIKEWLAERQIPAAVWTDLAPRFLRGTRFTTEAAVNHWKGLSPQRREAARAYVNQAPLEVDTDLRRLFREQGLV
jgi:hypothetical protein